jgi:hypothetical protein
MMACTLAAWLHVCCRLSRSATSKVLRVMEVIILTAMNIGSLMARSSPSTSNTPLAPSFTLLNDVRTAISSLPIEPRIICSICCPKCYMNYSLHDMLQVCPYKETYRSKRCGERLWMTRITKGGPRIVPHRLYSTQDFESWLEFFLSRPGIEDLIDKSYVHQQSSDTMELIWDSPVWHSLGPFTTTPGNITFSFFIDWFNPFSNKIAGKSTLCGAIILFCLNLLYELQHLPQFTFFAGITPPPNEPTVTTITALSDPIVDRLHAMWQGKTVCTHRHPKGAFKHVAVLPAVRCLLRK